MERVKMVDTRGDDSSALFTKEECREKQHIPHKEGFTSHWVLISFKREKDMVIL